MTRFESSLADFDPTLQPIGYELATELLATPDERAQTVVVRLALTPATPASPIDWFAPAEPAPTPVPEADVEPDSDLRRAS